MTRLIFATHNKNKLREVRQILGGDYQVLSLDDIPFSDEIPEPYDNIGENSRHKAQYFFSLTHLPCISEDSGLEVESLNGKPGAFSARYAGPEKDDTKNLEKLLQDLTGIENRRARFVSVFSYKDHRELVSYEGEVHGTISESPRGIHGFGYDPVFIAAGQDRTNAELTPEEKNIISHRKKALSKLVEYLASDIKRPL